MAQRATDAPEPLRTKIRNEITTRLQDFQTPTGIQMPAATYLTTATA